MKLALAGFAIATMTMLGAAHAAPVGLSGVTAPSAVQDVDWRRVCDRDGDRCHRVWVRDHDDRNWRRVCDHDGDRCHWVRR